MKSFKDWRKESKHLPEFMRDFHEQKDVFKAMVSYFDNSEEMPVSWVDGHVFTIDWFLWFMAAHGYTLQKTKAKCNDFVNIEETIANSKISRLKELKSIMGG
jgi:hypothetical protein